MNEERISLLLSYIKNLATENHPIGSYDAIGRRIIYVYSFLENAESVDIKGYRKYKMLFVQDDIKSKGAISQSICDFLSFLGKKTRKKRSRQEAQAIVVEKKAVVSDEKTKKTINDFLYNLTSEQDLSESTRNIYKVSLNDYFRYFHNLNNDNARKYIALLEGNGYSPKTIVIRIMCLERFAKFIKISISIKRPKITKSLSVENIPTLAEYKKLLDYLKSINELYYWQIRILAATGMRVSEFIKITWADVINGDVVIKGKGSKFRRVFFPAEISNSVKEFIKKCSIPENNIVAACRNARITDRGFSQRLKTLGIKAGLPKEKCHPHAFRHFFAKQYLKQKNDVIALADLLGHSSVDTTRVYLQKSYAEQKKDFNRCVTW